MLSLQLLGQQNLVPNPSFEEFSSCPLENELGNGEFTKCNDWWYPHTSSIGTPDYFNACNNSIGGTNQGMVGVPKNFWGYQEAFHGEAYVGLGLFEYDTNQMNIFSREMIQTNLNHQLKACHRYKISMNISLANKASHSAINLGIILSSDSIYFNDVSAKEATWINNKIIHDTLNWMRIEGEFISSGGEKYLSIGYFQKYNSQELVFNDSSTINNFGTYLPYYYIDSISLTEVGLISDCIPEIPNIITPNGDLINDYISIEGLELSNFTITNRWGNQITSLSKDNYFWDGTSNGKKCTEGTYYYSTDFKGTKLTGFIELVR